MIKLKNIAFLFFFCLFIKINKCQINKCKLSNSLFGVNVAIGFPRLSDRSKSNGTLNIAAIFTDFSDAISTISPQQMLSKLSPVTEDFFFRNSYGKLKLNISPYYKWLRMSKPSSQYIDRGTITFEKHKAYLQEAANLASSSGVDFSKIDLIVVLTNPKATAYSYSPAFCSNPTNGIKIGGKEFLNGVTTGADYMYWTDYGLNGNGYLLIHELSHNLGLPDLYSFTGETHQFVGQWSLMSNINANAKGYFGWERWLVGWLDDSQVSCIANKTNTAIVSLSAIETIDNDNPIKIVVIPIGIKQAVVVEARRNTGDDIISKEGILVYLVDTNVRTGNGPIRVLPFNPADINKLNSVLSVGGTITYGAATVTFKSNISNIFQVQIKSTYTSV